MDINSYWKKLSYREKFSIIGLLLSAGYIFIVAPFLFMLTSGKGGFFGCHGSFSNCYINAVFLGAISGVPIILGIMVCSVLVGYVLEK